MNEQELFYKVFLEHHYDGQYYQLLDGNKKSNTIKRPTYEFWQSYFDSYDVLYGTCPSNLINSQYDYFEERLNPWDNYFNIFKKPLNGTGFDWLQMLHPKCENREKWGRMKASKISAACADISVNPVANPSIVFDSKQPRVHPGRNLVSAHQILNKELKVIRFSSKQNTDIYTPINEIKYLNNLTDIVDLFDNIPIGFIEQSHIHMYCFHGNYSKRDKNGYVDPPKIDLALLCTEIAKNFDSKTHFPVKINDDIIEIPQVYDVKEIDNFFQYYYNKTTQ